MTKESIKLLEQFLDSLNDKGEERLQVIVFDRHYGNVPILSFRAENYLQLSNFFEADHYAGGLDKHDALNCQGKYESWKIDEEEEDPRIIRHDQLKMHLT